MKTIPEPSLPQISVTFILGVGMASLSNVLNPMTGPINNLSPGLLALMMMSLELINLQATKHANKINAGISPVHWQADIVRVVVGFALCSIIHAYYYHIDKVLYLLAAGLCWFGILFTLMLNRLRGLAFDYVSNDKHSSLQDRFFHFLDVKFLGNKGIAGTLQLVIYIVMFVFFSIQYIR
jgi:hypothetical protein